MTSRDRLKVGDRVRLAGRHSVPCHNPYSCHDTAINASEIGTVARTPYTAHDGTPMAAWSIEFERGRSIVLSASGSGLETDYAAFLLNTQAADWRKI